MHAVHSDAMKKLFCCAAALMRRTMLHFAAPEIS